MTGDNVSVVGFQILQCPHCDRDLWLRVDAAAMWGAADPVHGPRPSDPNPFPRHRWFRKAK